MKKTQIIMQQGADGHTSTHVAGNNSGIATTFEEAALKDYRIMAGCFYVVLRVLEQENPEMYRMLKMAHAGIHPSRLIKAAQKKKQQEYLVALP